jgi:hypothetical protein
MTAWIPSGKTVLLPEIPIVLRRSPALTINYSLALRHPVSMCETTSQHPALAAVHNQVKHCDEISVSTPTYDHRNQCQRASSVSEFAAAARHAAAPH